MSNVTLQGLFNNAAKYLSKNSSAILTGCGIAGIVVTAVSAVSAGIEIKEQIDAAESAKGESLTQKEIVQTTWKTCVPVVAAGSATAACFIGSQAINTRRNLMLASLYSMTANNFNDYREAVVAKLGEKKEQEVQDDISRKKIDNDPVSSSEVIMTDGDTLCYDSWSGRYFRSSIEKIRSASNTINEDLRNELTSTLNDFYFLLNLPSVKAGDKTGWNIDKPLSVYFSSQIAENNEPCIVLNYYTEPMEDYRIF